MLHKATQNSWTVSRWTGRLARPPRSSKQKARVTGVCDGRSKVSVRTEQGTERFKLSDFFVRLMRAFAICKHQKEDENIAPSGSTVAPKMQTHISRESIPQPVVSLAGPWKPLPYQLDESQRRGLEMIAGVTAVVEFPDHFEVHSERDGMFERRKQSLDPWRVRMPF